jgi:hypothetical protein
MTRISTTDHTQRQREFRPQRTVIALGTLGLFVAIIIGALYLSQSSSTSTLGRQLEDLIVERSILEQQNEQLRAEIAALQGIPRLLARAQELGFVAADAADIEYLVIPGYNPQREREIEAIAAEAEAAAVEAVPVYDESFAGWLSQQWQSLREQAERFTAE